MTPPTDIPFLSPSTAKTLTELTPFHAWSSHYMLGGGEKREQSDSALFGTVVDRLVFGVGPEIVVRKPKERTEPDRFKVFVTQDVLDKATACAGSVTGFAEKDGIRFLPENSQPKWKWQSVGGVWCSARPDWFGPVQNQIIDLKSSYSLKDKSIANTIQEYGYDIQAAAYVEAARAVTGERASMRFLFVESRTPYACRWVELDSIALGDGMAKWLKSVTTWKECLDSGVWPGWSDLAVSRPAWKKTTTEWTD